MTIIMDKEYRVIGITREETERDREIARIMEQFVDDDEM
jgi:hypothetical protein